MNNLTKSALTVLAFVMVAACGGTQNLADLPVRDGPQAVSPNPTSVSQ